MVKGLPFWSAIGVGEGEGCIGVLVVLAVLGLALEPDAFRALGSEGCVGAKAAWGTMEMTVTVAVTV